MTIAKKIRRAYINRLVLTLYAQMKNISFPINPYQIIKDYMPNCRFVSYEQFAKIADYTIDEVIASCERDRGLFKGRA